MRKVYFGNANKQVWIPAPQTGLKANSSGKVYQNELLNGRTSISRSGANSRRFSASWLGPLNAPEIEDSLHTIKDFYDGVYGDGPFYWNDPYATKSNMMPPHWAAPGLGRNDWPEIASFAATEYLATDSNSNDYPTYSARFNITSTDEVTSTRVLTFIIPEGYTLHFGWHGVVDSGDAGIRIKRTARVGGAETTIDPAAISVTSSNRTNSAVSGDVYSKVEIYIYKPSGSASDITISGMIAQLLAGTAVPEAGGFIGGRGTSGMEFAGPVNIDYYSANINDGQVGLSTEWQEI